jgi:hypothetical protein
MIDLKTRNLFHKNTFLGMDPQYFVTTKTLQEYKTTKGTKAKKERKNV